MTKKMMLVAASALAALAVAALPAVASASPVVDVTPGTAFSGTFGTATLTSTVNEGIVCSGENHVNGEWTSNTGGNIHLLFTNCHTESGISCHSGTLGSGEITVNSAPFEVVYIKGFTKTVGGLVTPPAGGTYANFQCSFLAHVEVKGNGVLGHLSEPTCTTGPSSTSTLNFTSSAKGVQTYQEIEGSAVKYHLTSNLNGSGFTEASEDVTGAKTTLAGGATANLTCL